MDKIKVQRFKLNTKITLNSKQYYKLFKNYYKFT